MKKTLLTLLILAVTVNGFAAEEDRLETLREKLVGSMVKTFAKTYVATTNLNKFKEKNIKKLQKMDEAKFQRVYDRIYQEIMVDLPQHLKERYGISERMTRERAIAQINTFTNKKQIYRLINSIPNRMIAKHFVKHKDEFDKTMKKGKKIEDQIDQLLEDPQAKTVL